MELGNIGGPYLPLSSSYSFLPLPPIFLLLLYIYEIFVVRTQGGLHTVYAGRGGQSPPYTPLNPPLGLGLRASRGHCGQGVLKAIEPPSLEWVFESSCGLIVTVYVWGTCFGQIEVERLRWRWRAEQHSTTTGCRSGGGGRAGGCGAMGCSQFHDHPQVQNPAGVPSHCPTFPFFCLVKHPFPFIFFFFSSNTSNHISRLGTPLFVLFLYSFLLYFLSFFIFLH